MEASCVTGHRAYIYDRGGRNKITEITSLTRVRWGRRRDEFSEASILIQGDACSEQAEELANIEPKRHELVIFRGSRRVWEGVIWRAAWGATTVELFAHDVFAYVQGTPLSQGYSNASPNQGPVTTRIETILEAEMQVWETLDPPANVLPHLQIHHFPNEAQTTAITTPFEMSVGEHIDALAHRSGIDYTTVGRAIHVWDTSRSLGRLRTLTEEDFLGEVVITAYGADHTEVAYVVAEDGRFGTAGSPSSYYGPWTKIFTVYNEEGTEAPTQSELDSQAQRNITGRSPVPIEVRIPDNSTLRLSHDLTIDDLVCGVQVPLRATLNARKLTQMQKLDLVTVTETATGETVQITLSPATTPDSDI
jgi:hypothetical protein